MSVEERWEIEDERAQRVTEHGSPAETHGGRMALIALVIVLGISLSWLTCTSLSALPAPSPTPIPRSLEATVKREAQALAQGDVAGFLRLQDTADTQWYNVQRSSFITWGVPSGGEAPWYEVIHTGTLASDRAWADVRQFHTNGYIRETRFYRSRAGEWVRTRPDLAFWGGRNTLDSVHFGVSFEAGDEELIQYVIARFEAAYARLCTDLGCDIRPEHSRKYGDEPDWYSPYPIWYSPYPRVLSITLVVRPDLDRLAWRVIDRGRQVTITIPSPRVLGIVDSWLGQTDPMDQRIFDSLVEPVARIATGGIERWSGRQGGQLFFDAVMRWERDWLQPLSPQSLRFARPPLRAAEADLLPLESLWYWPHESATNTLPVDRLQRQAASVVVFMAREFGLWSLAYFMRAIRSAESLPEAIEATLDVNYADFVSQWRAWLARYE
ncbi:MAG TPA: hypothetical protein VJG32_07855 [Anaerolineae bacterium]|nr:hypothetical protein [Anaerolineae bacterium]